MSKDLKEDFYCVVCKKQHTDFSKSCRCCLKNEDKNYGTRTDADCCCSKCGRFIPRNWKVSPGIKSECVKHNAEKFLSTKVNFKTEALKESVESLL